MIFKFEKLEQLDWSQWITFLYRDSESWNKKVKAFFYWRGSQEFVGMIKVGTLTTNTSQGNKKRWFSARKSWEHSEKKELEHQLEDRTLDFAGMQEVFLHHPVFTLYAICGIVWWSSQIKTLLQPSHSCQLPWSWSFLTLSTYGSLMAMNRIASGKPCNDKPKSTSETSQ